MHIEVGLSNSYYQLQQWLFQIERKIAEIVRSDFCVNDLLNIQIITYKIQSSSIVNVGNYSNKLSL